MIFEEPEIRLVIDRIIERVNRHPSWNDDLMQEALVHLWRVEQARPHQRPSWYLQSCQFHLLHYMQSGRSVDSWKRRAALVSSSLGDEDQEPGQPVADHSATSATSAVHAHEILELLDGELTASQKKVLNFLAEGLSCREIGSRLGVSHNAVIKQRRRIARAAVALGLASPPA